MAVQPSLETERLYLRKATPDDAHFFLALLTSKGWLDNIGDRGVYTLADAKKYVEEKILPGYQVPGQGTMLCLLKSDGTIIGNTGIYDRPGLDLKDFGFAFLEAFHGQGYAFEASVANLAHAKSHGINELLAITLPTNGPSLRLLGRLGFEREKMIRLEGDPEELVLLRRGANTTT